MLDTDMPIWWQAIQVVGYLEIVVLFAILPFERKHEYLSRAEQWMPKSLLSIPIVLLIGIPMAWAGLCVWVAYLIFVGCLYAVTK